MLKEVVFRRTDAYQDMVSTYVSSLTRRNWIFPGSGGNTWLCAMNGLRLFGEVIGKLFCLATCRQ